MTKNCPDLRGTARRITSAMDKMREELRKRVDDTKQRLRKEVPGLDLLRLTAASIVAFLVLPFSEDFIVLISGEKAASCGSVDVRLIVFDAAAFLVVALLLGFRRMPRKSLHFLLTALMLSMVIDLTFGTCARDSPILLGIAAAYAVPQVLVLFALIHSRDGPVQPETSPWTGIPLVAGAVAAWFAGILVYGPLDVVLREGTPRINQEYFAQVSQLIPLLAAAVLLEPKLFKSPVDTPPAIALRRTLVTVLIIGEGAALAGLVRPQRLHLDPVGQWLEYYALLITVYAIFAALSSFAVATGVSSTSSRKPDEPSSA